MRISTFNPQLPSRGKKEGHKEGEKTLQKLNESANSKNYLHYLW